MVGTAIAGCIGFLTGVIIGDIASKWESSHCTCDHCDCDDNSDYCKCEKHHECEQQEDDCSDCKCINRNNDGEDAFCEGCDCIICKYAEKDDE